jgi:4-carboxymuconolactone decarboxylase
VARLTLPLDSDQTDEQRRVCEEVVAGRRGKVPAPMIAWLRNPELARRGQRLGELLRFETVLPPHLTELSILICARHWTSHHEWTAHKRLALEAGLDSDIIASIASRGSPAFVDAKARMVYDVSRALLEDGRLTNAAYAAAITLLGECALVELVATIGYYCLVSLTLNAFELGLPENAAPELADSVAASLDAS